MNVWCPSPSLHRFLQRKFDEAGPAAVALVLPEVLANLIELMMDPFGNYLVQKMLDRCSEDQRLEVRSLVCPWSLCRDPRSLMHVCMSTCSDLISHDLIKREGCVVPVRC